MEKEKKNKLALDVSELALSSIMSSKLLKYSKIIAVVTFGVLSIGYSAKIINYSISNLKVLAKTLKSN
jgi:hypothetical protein